MRERLTARPVRPQAIWFGVAPCAGVLERVDGLRDTPDGVTIVLEVQPGEPVGALDSSDSRVLFARAAGDTAAEAVGRARGAVAECRVVVAAAAVSSSGSDGVL